MLEKLVFFLKYSVLVIGLDPLPIILPIIIGTGVYYWFLKPISVIRALVCSLINMIVFFVMASLAHAFNFNHIIDFLPKTLKPVPGLICIVVINVLLIHFVSKHSFKKLILPVIINMIIMVASIMLLSQPMLGM